MKSYNLIKMQKKVKKYMDEDRYAHTQGVMYMCAALAMAHGEDLMSAQVAGLLHDCAKCMSNDKKLKICEKNGIAVSVAEAENPFLLHAKLGAYLARKKYDVEEEDILNAIRYHTTGRPRMSRLEKIVYIADYIEPLRNKAQNLPLIRERAFCDLDETMYLILRDTLEYLGTSADVLDPMTKMAYDYYKENREEN
ncbi:MAG: bis(5'-nucleosyl)-tetraphosphatase (symmetrical) YqeK [Robinsoniella sp.]|nr:bis(5'-nucleosyl)-tetraphosphatase (symmetrical) YqeK [Robinsoniella sp.]